MSQNVPQCPTFSQTRRQRQDQAITMILAGATDVAVAKELKINRRTVYRWRTRGARFRRSLALRRAELYQNATDRLRAMLSPALDLLEKQVRDPYAPTALRAARALLALSRIGGAVSQSRPARAARNGPSTPPAIRVPGAMDVAETGQVP
ncbi:MAG: helix-turn-helix domain-containing protein [Tepidisphaeraceae bacterium]